jgi:hypothetical protein
MRAVRIAALAAALAAACSGANSTGIEPVSCPPTGTTLTYLNFGEDMIATNCANAGCHDRKAPQLTTQAAIIANKDAILDEAVYTDAMPENHDMLLEDRRKLGEWLACGAP